MKIIQSIESTYEDRKGIYQKLKEKVDVAFLGLKKQHWHYVSRVKEIESYALKLETGRFINPSELEDFFACTLVVENLEQINAAIDLVDKAFTIISRKPKDALFTHKEPSSFQFDDLRLTVTLKQAEYLPEEPLNTIPFEVQIKTFLQYAWGLATHDLIYKSEEINWSKERIAFQIKAMLEQAELSISGVKGLSLLPEVAKDNRDTTSQKEILAFINHFFNIDDLPKDLVRLTKNIQELIVVLKIDVNELMIVMNSENNLGRGTNSKNLSPYLLIVQSLIYQRPVIIDRFINNTKSKFKLFLPKEIQITGITIRSRNNIIRENS